MYSTPTLTLCVLLALHVSGCVSFWVKPDPDTPCPDVAFTARYRGGEITVTDGDVTLPYNVVTSNPGGGFSSATSTFTAPIDGFYNFNVTVTTGTGNSMLMVVLTVNGKGQAATVGQGPSATPPRLQSALLLRTGDIVRGVLRRITPLPASLGANGSTISGRVVRCLPTPAPPV